MSSSAIPSTLSFNGSSTFASSFQNVLNRAVDIASLPMQSLQNDVSTLQSKQSVLTSLGQTFTALQAAVTNISSAVAGSPVASSSNQAAVAITADSTALPGTYTIQVNSLGSSTTTLSKAGLTTVTDPTVQDISGSTNFTLTINGTNHNITSSGTTLDDLVSAINGSGDGVQATIVNVGSTASPDYRLAVTSNNLAPDAISLTDSTNTSLLDTLSTGANLQYQVAGQSTVISGTSNQVTLSPGLTVQLNQQTTSPVSITVTQSNAGLSNALNSFASAYNAAVAAVGQQRGESGGALTGDSLIFELGTLLGKISTYTSGSGSVSSLANLGLTLNQDGTLTFNSSTFSSASASDIQSFLGSTSTGGLLQMADSALQTFTDTVSGSIGNEFNTLQKEITSDNTKITSDKAEISTIQTNLQQQLSAADAAIATLQSQNSYMQQLFTATYGGNSGANTIG